VCVCVCVCVIERERDKVQYYPSTSTMMWSKGSD